MAMLLQPILDIHDYIVYDLPGINKNDVKYPLMGSHIPLLVIVGAYYYFCTTLGPKMMKNRQPYSLRTVMIWFNIFQVLGNLYVFLMASYLLSKTGSKGLNLLCVRRGNANALIPGVMDEADHIAFFYVILKVSDLLDTVFMVLKKNFRQITILHVYHHATMPICSSLYFQYSFQTPTQSMWTGLPNMFVHVAMYSYYLLTTFEPKFKKNIAMKKCITILQLIQFVFVVIMNTLVTFQNDCPTSRLISSINYVQSVVFFVLFANFYFHTYVRAKKLN